MKWFTNNKKKLEMLQAIRPSSKATLKIQCLMLCNGKVDEAEKLYDYFAKDMPELPDYDAPVPTWFDNTKDVANGIVRLPPLFGAVPDAQATSVANPLPPINE